MRTIDQIKEGSNSKNVNKELKIQSRTPIVSVVIPLYNKGRHIRGTLNSVLDQTIQDFEIIIVDDGLTDDGHEIVKNFKDSRINLILQDNAGVAAASTRGIKESKSYLNELLDADDEWNPFFIETILKLRNEYPEAGAYAILYYIQKSKLNILLINLLLSKKIHNKIPEIQKLALSAGERLHKITHMGFNRTSKMAFKGCCNNIGRNANCLIEKGLVFKL